MKQQNFNKLTLSISLALAGLLALQFYWTHESLLLADKQFEQNVYKSFQTLNRDLEKDEAAYFLKRSDKKHRRMRMWKSKLDSLKWNIHNGISHSIDSLVIDNGTNENIVFKQKIKIANQGGQDEMMIEFDVSDSGNLNQSIEEAIDMKSRQMEKIFIEMMSADGNPFKERLNLENLEERIKLALEKNGIFSNFEYRLVGHGFFGHNVLQQNTSHINPNKSYSTLLLPGLMGRGKHELLISFPNKKLFMMRHVWIMLAASILLILIVIYAFYYSIKTLIKQRKVAEIKNDFISNMTHELKTPITSINLACETIQDDNFDFNNERVNSYLQIISDENKRLKTLVNSVLDSSFIDSEELKLTKSKENIISLIKGVIKRFDLIITNVDGRIVLLPEEGNIEIDVDKFHISNAIFNLIDNAIKYTEDKPLINISVSQNKNTLVLIIKDNGIGVSKVEQSKIFTKFHRVSKGNIHNVKGFGLGLSYVKKIIELHSGSITIDSELGKGSEFKLELPL